MQIDLSQDARLLAWAAERLEGTFAPETCRWVAGLADGGVVFVVVYSHFSSRNCQLSIATDGSKRWATRRTLRAIFSAPFAHWNLRRVTFVVAADNDRSLKMMQHCGRSPLGVVPEGRVRAAFPNDVDGLLFGMLREECRWLR